MKTKHWTMIGPAVLLCTSPAYAVELRDAVQAALNSNPEIRQAVANRVATQEERVQAQGLWYPRISVEGSAGVRNLRNPTRRNIGIADQTLGNRGDLIVDQCVQRGGLRGEIRARRSAPTLPIAREEPRNMSRSTSHGPHRLSSTAAPVGNRGDMRPSMSGCRRLREVCPGTSASPTSSRRRAAAAACAGERTREDLEMRRPFRPTGLH